MKKLVRILIGILFLLSLVSFVYAGFLLCKTLGFVVLGVVLMLCTYVLDTNLDTQEGGEK